MWFISFYYHDRKLHRKMVMSLSSHCVSLCAESKISARFLFNLLHFATNQGWNCKFKMSLSFPEEPILGTLRFNDYGQRLRTCNGSKLGRRSRIATIKPSSCLMTVGSRCVSRCRDYVNQNMSSSLNRYEIVSLHEQEQGRGPRKSLTSFASSIAVGWTSIRNK